MYSIKKGYNIINSLFYVSISLTVLSQFNESIIASLSKSIMYIIWILLVLYLVFVTKKGIYVTNFGIYFFSATFILIITNLMGILIIEDYTFTTILVPTVIAFFMYLTGNLLKYISFKEKHIKMGLLLFCIFSFLLSVYIWATYFGDISSWFKAQENIYMKKNSAGQILAVSILILLNYIKFNRKILNLMKYIMCIFMFFIIMIIHCRTALLALTISMIGKMFLIKDKKKRQKYIRFILLVLCLLLIIPDIREVVENALYLNKYDSNVTLNTFTSNRFDWYTAALDKFKNSNLTIIFGLGKSYVDNLYINTLTSSGILGFIIIVPVCLYRFWINFRKRILVDNSIEELIKVMTIFYFFESIAEGLPPFGPGACSVVFWILCGYIDVKFVKNNKVLKF